MRKNLGMHFGEGAINNDFKVLCLRNQWLNHQIPSEKPIDEVFEIELRILLFKIQ